MVPITSKPITSRLAIAIASVTFSNVQPHTLISTHSNKKGDVLSVARVAGIMAAKKCPEIVPLCHPSIGITGVEINIEMVPPSSVHVSSKFPSASSSFGRADITATVSCEGKTGVEMEAITAAMGAALTIYDMCKAVDKGMVIGQGKVVKKEGGKSGSWTWEGAFGEEGDGTGDAKT